MKFIIGSISLLIYLASFYLLRDIEWSQFFGAILFVIAAVIAFVGE